MVSACAFWATLGGPRTPEHEYHARGHHEGHIEKTMNVSGLETVYMVPLTLFRMTVGENYEFDVSMSINIFFQTSVDILTSEEVIY
jgi:hypothetical protein